MSMPSVIADADFPRDGPPPQPSNPQRIPSLLDVLDDPTPRKFKGPYCTTVVGTLTLDISTQADVRRYGEAVRKLAVFKEHKGTYFTKAGEPILIGVEHGNGTPFADGQAWELDDGSLHWVDNGGPEELDSCRGCSWRGPTFDDHPQRSRRGDPQPLPSHPPTAVGLGAHVGALYGNGFPLLDGLAWKMNDGSLHYVDMDNVGKCSCRGCSWQGDKVIEHFQHHDPKQF